MLRPPAGLQLMCTFIAAGIGQWDFMNIDCFNILNILFFVLQGLFLVIKHGGEELHRQDSQVHDQ